MIKYGLEIGKKDNKKYIWSACDVCGKERWVRYSNGKVRHTRCLKCAILKEKNDVAKISIVIKCNRGDKWQISIS